MQREIEQSDGDFKKDMKRLGRGGGGQGRADKWKKLLRES
jgi:hypothetical protein